MHGGRLGRKAVGLVRSRTLKWVLKNWIGQVADCEYGKETRFRNMAGIS